MGFRNLLTVLIVLVTTSSCDKKSNSSASVEIEAVIFPTGNKITNDNFSGTVFLQSLIEADSLNACAVGNVSFKPGSRTNWHYHPGGQILLAISGTGYYQEKGSPVKILRKGDAVKCPPKIHHWHGASQEEEFIQVAITNTQHGPTVWLEKVGDEEYDRAAESVKQ